jgi:hypothetical protein
MTTSSLLGMECTRFLKYWLSSIFWVQSLIIPLKQFRLGPDGAERHIGLSQLNGCPLTSFVWYLGAVLITRSMTKLNWLYAIEWGLL